MAELTIPDVLHRLPPLVEEAKGFLRRCRTTKRPRIYMWRGPRRCAAVYPGSFDPWTLAHDAILRAARRRVRGPVLLLLDLRTIDKPKHASGLAERLAMLALHFAEDRRVAIGVSTHGRFLDKARALGRRVRFVVGEDTWKRVIAPRYYKDPERELAELHARAEFLVAPRGKATRGTLPISRTDQARSATKARAALSRGRTPFDQLSPDVLLCCWQLRLYNNPRLLPVWVVTAFLERGGGILFLKRSARVGTYRARWSGISGYLDWPICRLERLLEQGSVDSALSQAVKEVREETGIQSHSLRLMRRGTVVAVADKAQGREWRVCPFLFRVKPGIEPRLDWENICSLWLPPFTIPEFCNVPGILDALGAAFGGWSRWYRESLVSLERDRRKGSMSIARWFLGIEELADDRGCGGDVVRRAVRLSRAHPMGVLEWVLDKLAKGRPAHAIRSELGRQDTRLLVGAARRLRSVRAIATYSNSSTVRDLLRWLAMWKHLVVSVLPDAEGHGRRMHVALLANGVRARLSARPPRDAVLVIGADAVMPDGSIINARGTADAIRKAGLPVVVLAQRCKYVKRAPRLRRGFERVPASLLRDAEFIS